MLAISGGPMVWMTFLGLNRAQIVSGIYFALRRAGWAAAVIPGGYALTATSPQSGTLAVTVSVWDPGSGSQAFIQFSSASGSGLVHRLGTSSGRVYQIVAYQSEFWVSRPGVLNGSEGTVICGGIPFIPPTELGASDSQCTGAGTATECWWAIGDYSGSFFFPSDSPRVNLNYHAANGTVVLRVGNEGRYNGNYVSGGGDGDCRILTKNHCTDSGAPTSGSHLRYPDESPLLFDPLVCFGDVVTGPLKVRGQNWNAQVVSEAHPMDDTSATFVATQLDPRFRWVNFTHNYFYGSLYLAVPAPSAMKPKTYVY